ncbi:KaiC domain-containing protein [Halorubrum ejinorense]|uniref:KaiC domain-containing protein n=1 Tax=Halorubrum ejinorense TaxID=425309 RepID=A0AAV3SSE5_9EURY
MSEEDDWFERALRETDEESDERPVGGPESDSADAETDGEADETDHGDEDAPADPESAADPESTTDDTESVDPFGGAVDEASDDGGATDPFGGGGESDDDPGDGGDPFGGGSESFADLGGGDDGGGGDHDGLDAPANGDEPADRSTKGVPADAFGDLSGDGDEDFGSFGGSGSFGGDDPFGGSGDPEPDPGTGSASGTGRDPEPADGSGDPFGEDDPFGGSRGGSGTGDSGGGSPSDGGGADPFGGYRGSSGGSDDDFGFGELGGGAGGGDTADFDVDPDEFESEIDRTDIGIKGLDDMILGGVPRRSLLSVIGGAGTGKTTFALQFLNHALESGEKGVYITLEQTRESIFDTADEKGWSFREHADEGRLAVVAIDPIEMANSLASIRNDLIRLIAEFDADRLVLDSVSLLEMMYDHPAKRRSEVFGFTRSLKEAGVTTLLTSEASEDTAYASRHGIVEYLTDAVFVLQYVRGSDFRETRLAVEIQKIRDANHSRETKPYDITDTGISVYDQANIF